MIPDHGQQTPKGFIPSPGSHARLIINGSEVGDVVVRGWDSSWAFGTFTPSDGFSKYAQVFGVWSLLMHNDEDAPLHETASAALAEAERQMDALHAEIHFVDRNFKMPIGQLNIDGELIEWKTL